MMPRFFALSGLLLLFLCLAITRIAQAEPAAHALPTDFAVAEGNANAHTSGTDMTITQTGNRAVIDWTSFDIGRDASVHFDQSTNAIAINRIGNSSGSPTQIYGRLSADGTIILLDGNGVQFGRDAVIDVGGIVAGTGNLSDTSAFMNGQSFQITDTDALYADAAVINNSQNFSARDHGLIAFVAPRVVNNGVMTARLGSITLASGTAATLDFYGDRLLNLAVTAPLVTPHIRNSGSIIADGGTVHLTARAVSGVVAQVINNTGMISAQRAEMRDGKIILDGGAAPVTRSNAVMVGTDAGIQPAIDTAKADGSTTIYVAGGTYRESLRIATPLTLRGESSSVLPLLQGDVTENGITVSADNVTIENFSIRRMLNGIYADGAKTLRLAGLFISDSVADGIALIKTADAQLERNTVYNSDGHGIALSGTTGTNIYNQNIVFMNDGHALYALNNSGLKMSDNDFSSSGAGADIFIRAGGVNDSLLRLPTQAPTPPRTPLTVEISGRNEASSPSPAFLAQIEPAAGDDPDETSETKALGAAFFSGLSAFQVW